MATTKFSTYMTIENVKDPEYGAVGDGVTDDTVAIQAAIDAVNAAGGGTVFLPKGTYSLSASASTETWTRTDDVTLSAANCCLVMRANVNLIGAGRSHTKLVASSTESLIYLADGSNSSVESLWLEGEFDDGDSSAAHGIFNVVTDKSNDVDNVQFRDLYITRVGSYGIGLNEGNLINSTIDNVVIKTVGADGIDHKSRAPDLSIDSGNHINNVVVEDFGLRVTGSVGVDLRGSWNGGNITVQNFGDGVDTFGGVRLRPEDATYSNNVAIRCNISNLLIDCGDNANTTALQLQGNYCNVSNVAIYRPDVGVSYAGSTATTEGSCLTNVTVTAHKTYAYRSTTSGDNIVVANFNCFDANSATAHYRVEGDGHTFVNCTGDDSATMWSVATSAAASFSRVGHNALYEDVIDIRELTSGRAGIAARGPSTNIDLDITPKGTGGVRLTDGTDGTKRAKFDLSGATTNKLVTLASSHTDNRTLTLPDATDTVVARDTTDTLTNKTIDTASNTITVAEADISDLQSYLVNIVEDTTPQLGGPLDTNGNDIIIDTAGAIEDDSNNEYILFSKAASAVNEITIANAATGSGPTISATGSDTNIDLNINAKGSGDIEIGSDVYIETSSNPLLRIYSEDLARTSFTDISDKAVNQLEIRKLNAGGASIIDFRPDAGDGTSNASVRYFRSTNTSGDVFLEVFKGDGTSTSNAKLAGNGQDSYVCNNNGDFGVGTNAPAGKLDVSGGLLVVHTASATIATGAITATGNIMTVDTESAASSDDLDTINGGVDGAIIHLKAANAARTVVAKDGTGNLILAGDFSMDNTDDVLTLMSDGTNWREVSRSDNGA